METKEQIIKNKIKNYYKNKYKNEKVIKKYDNIRLETKINQIFDNITRRIYKVLTLKNITRNIIYKKLLGCNLQEFELYLISKLQEGMTFDNYGEWEIDHIKPISKFNLNNENELLECCNYKNLQPLWKIENRSKFNKYEEVITNIIT